MNGTTSRRNSIGRLDTSNDRRSKLAAARTVEKARAGIDIITSAPPARGSTVIAARKQYVQVLRLRVKYPDDSLTQLAKRMGVTKNAYWSLLRRALLHANKIRLKDGR